jgi:leucyl/phenylalanyl-tRNA--protein transferase
MPGASGLRRQQMQDELTPEIVLYGYRMGLFPMADLDGEIYWYSPDPRCIFEYHRFRVPRSLRQVIRRGTFAVRVDTVFEQVIRACADRPEGTWISPQIMAVYTELHRLGYAHSVEAWQGDALAGGLYGVTIGGAFFGESMFYHVPDASKVTLVALIERLRARGFTLIDTQWSTPHVLRFGALEIPREEYLRRLEQAVALPCRFAE